MTSEAAFIAALRKLANHPGARRLADDAAVLEIGGKRLVLTHDVIVEGVHFLRSDPPEDVAWKLVAVNLSDLAAKGARPLGVLLGYPLHRDESWNAAFVRGLEAVLGRYDVPLLGGDTVSAPQGAAASLSLTAIGEGQLRVPDRAGAREGDILWVSGTIGDAGAGLRIGTGELNGPSDLLQRYRRPEPRLALGAALAPLVAAMMDVSDGLLIDAARMAEASGLAVEIELGDIPLSASLLALQGEGADQRIAAATAGDDYELLFAAAPERAEAIRALGHDVPITPIGRFVPGSRLVLSYRGSSVPVPPRLGYEHGTPSG